MTEAKYDRTDGENTEDNCIEEEVNMKLFDYMSIHVQYTQTESIRQSIRLKHFTIRLDQHYRKSRTVK